MIWSGQDGEPVLKRNNLFCATCLSCLYLVVSTKVNNRILICKGNQSIPPANFLHDMIHVDGLSARCSSPPMAAQFVDDDFALFSQKHRFSSVLVDFLVDFFASTAASTARSAGRRKNEKGSTIVRLSSLFFSRGDWIRTSDHTPPRRVL